MLVMNKQVTYVAMECIGNRVRFKFTQRQDADVALNLINQSGSSLFACFHMVSVTHIVTTPRTFKYHYITQLIDLSTNQ